MEDEAWLDIAPHYAAGIAVSRQKAHASAVSRVPAKRKKLTAEYSPHRKGQRKIKDDDEPRREGAVVDAGTMRDRDRHIADHFAVRRDDDMTDGIPHIGVIGDRVMLTGGRIQVWVSREGTGERSIERVVALLLQGLGELDGKATSFHHGKCTTADIDNVGVHGVVETSARTGRRFPAKRRSGQTRANPAVAVPEDAAVLDSDSVHHAVAEKPMMASGIGIDRVRPHLEISAIEPCRYRSGNDEVFERQLRPHRRVDPDEEVVIGLE